MPTVNSLAEVEEYLDKYHRFKWVDYNLDRMVQLMDFLGNPQDSYKTIHVAGTSGKTSTSYYIAGLLKEAGYKVGLTVSPHVNGINERMQIDLEPIDCDTYLPRFNDFIKLTDKSGVKSSWFEFITAFAFWYFAKEKVDYAVIEVGLGGFLDATNVINRADKVCVISDIGFDHMNILGNTLGEIAFQKAGIVQLENILITHKQREEVMEVYKEVCTTKKATLIVVDDPEIVKSEIPTYQQRNFNLAFKAYSYLTGRDGIKILDHQGLNITMHIQIPGRMEQLRYKGKTIIFDGAHNKQKMDTFVESYKKLYPKHRPAILLAVKDGKDVKEIASSLKPLASTIIATQYQENQDYRANSWPAKDVAMAFGGKVEVITEPDFKKAFRRLMLTDSDPVVVTGSFYLISKLKRELGLQ
jgi:dihydrofolate synthase/folylpolyglutamate synthase